MLDEVNDLKSLVEEALADSNLSNMEILVDGGEVTIHGDVDTQDEKDQVIELVKDVDGVTKIVTGINVAEHLEDADETYTVKPGDSMWAIAEKYLGNGADWMKIYEANKELIGKKPDLIHPGYVLKIPS
jgi:nucleoid-associated protein YgaU